MPGWLYPVLAVGAAFAGATVFVVLYVTRRTPRILPRCIRCDHRIGRHRPRAVGTFICRQCDAATRPAPPRSPR